MSFRLLVRALLLASAMIASAQGDALTVGDAAQLREAVRQAGAGTTITLLPGEYGHGLWLKGVSGTAEHPILLTGADAQNPPSFRGGTEAIHLVDCNFITLRNLKVSGCSGNGINADDGGSYDTPSVGLIFDGIHIEDIGPQGNYDALKLSGLQNFTVTNCTFSGWGGSAIDMVGCREGLITDAHFLGKDGFTQSSGIQAKGGTERVRIERSFFDGAGSRAINLGGSTGLPFFRPSAQGFEARDVEVVHNRFVGSEAPVAFVTSVRCVVRRNTFYHPGKWVARILQEQPADQFLPCQQGVFESNLVVFDRRVSTFVNVGPNTLPGTFVIRGNAWFCSDANRRPSLPVEETDGIYQVDPKLENPGTPRMRALSTDPSLQGIGATQVGFEPSPLESPK